MSAKKRQQRSRSKLSPWAWIIPIAVVAAVIGAVIFFQQGKTPAGTETTLPKEISAVEAAQKREAGAFLLDVRQPDEWEAVHIPGATLIPLDQLETRLNEVPRDQEVVVVCRSGNRSATGRDILLNAGFKQVTSMAGGMNDWQRQGLPTVSGP